MNSECLDPPKHLVNFGSSYPVSILHKSIAGRYRPVRVADGPIRARCRFIRNASWIVHYYILQYEMIL